MHVVIPAYRPGSDLPRVVTAIRDADPAAQVLVVDDGSGAAHGHVFDDASSAGATVLHVAANHGKGAALKTAFDHLIAQGACGTVVTADADGQHCVPDILAVAHAVGSGSAPHLVLGERRFDEATPARSRLGNAATRWLFRVGTGMRLHDTQTGLRAFPATLLPWLSELPGERYEFELITLLEATRAGVGLESVEISTIYVDDNSGSHFRPLVDSLRIYAPLLLFLASSFSAFLLDTVALLVLDALTANLLLSVIGARLLSATVNFVTNRRLVFADGDHWARAAARYVALAVTLLVANYLLLHSLVSLGVSLLPAKLGTESLLLGASYAVQATFVYGSTRAGPHHGCSQSELAPGHPLDVRESSRDQLAITTSSEPGR